MDPWPAEVEPGGKGDGEGASSVLLAKLHAIGTSRFPVMHRVLGGQRAAGGAQTLPPLDLVPKSSNSEVRVTPEPRVPRRSNGRTVSVPRRLTPALDVLPQCLMESWECGTWFPVP